RLRFADGVVAPQWSSRGQYAAGAEIDWLTPREDGGMTATFGSADDRLEISTTQVDVHLNGAVWPVSITEAGAFAPDNAPSAIEQDGSKVLVNYGFAGQAEIRSNQVAVQRRFLGWANFLYDPRSPLWGNDLFDTVGLIFTGHGQQVLSEWLGNRAWQHADILAKLMQTLVMAF